MVVKNALCNQMADIDMVEMFYFFLFSPLS